MPQSIIIHTLAGQEIRYTAVVPIHFADLYYLFRTTGYRVDAYQLDGTIHIRIIGGPK